MSRPRVVVLVSTEVNTTLDYGAVLLLTDGEATSVDRDFAALACEVAGCADVVPALRACIRPYLILDAKNSTAHVGELGAPIYLARGGLA